MRTDLTTVRLIMDDGSIILIPDALSVSTQNWTPNLFTRNCVRVGRPGTVTYQVNVTKVIVGRS